MRTRSALVAAAAVLGLALLLPDASSAQGGILRRARRAAERTVERAQDRAQQHVEAEVEARTDEALSSAFGEAGSAVGEILGLRGGASGRASADPAATLRSGGLMPSSITFEEGTATLTPESRQMVAQLGQRLGLLDEFARTPGGIRITFEGYAGSGGRTLAQRRARVVRDAVIEAGNLSSNWVLSGVASGSGPDGATIGIRQRNASR